MEICIQQKSFLFLSLETRQPLIHSLFIKVILILVEIYTHSRKTTKIKYVIRKVRKDTPTPTYS